MYLFDIFAKDQASVLSTEAKCVGQRHLDVLGPRLIGHVIQVAFRVRVIVIDGRVDRSLGDGLHADGGFQRTGGSQGMADHRFSGTDGYLVGQITE